MITSEEINVKGAMPVLKWLKHSWPIGYEAVWWCLIEGICWLRRNELADPVAGRFSEKRVMCVIGGRLSGGLRDLLQNLSDRDIGDNCGCGSCVPYAFVQYAITENILRMEHVLWRLRRRFRVIWNSTQKGMMTCSIGTLLWSHGSHQHVWKRPSTLRCLCPPHYKCYLQTIACL